MQGRRRGEASGVLEGACVAGRGGRPRPPELASWVGAGVPARPNRALLKDFLVPSRAKALLRHSVAGGTPRRSPDSTTCSVQRFTRADQWSVPTHTPTPGINAGKGRPPVGPYDITMESQ